MTGHPPKPTGSLLHALDLTAMQEFDEAKRLLEPLDDAVAGRLFLLICDLEQERQARGRDIAFVRHEIGNAISVAVANLEGMADGVVATTPERLEAIVQSLHAAGGLLDRLRRGPSREQPEGTRRESVEDIRALVSAHVEAIQSLAQAKRVKLVCESSAHGADNRTFVGDPARIAQYIRFVLTGALRYTAPGGRIEICCDCDAGALRVAASGLFGVSRLLEAIGGDAHLETSGEDRTVFRAVLPMTPS
jgi:signal transduction histidine kinase